VLRTDAAHTCDHDRWSACSSMLHLVRRDEQLPWLYQLLAAAVPLPVFIFLSLLLHVGPFVPVLNFCTWSCPLPLRPIASPASGPRHSNHRNHNRLPVFLSNLQSLSSVSSPSHSPSRPLPRLLAVTSLLRNAPACSRRRAHRSYACAARPYLTTLQAPRRSPSCHVAQRPLALDCNPTQPLLSSPLKKGHEIRRHSAPEEHSRMGPLSVSTPPPSRCKIQG
jgi:hypothetical protein